MKKHMVMVLEVPKDAPLGARPRLVERYPIEAADLGEARDTLLAKLANEYRPIRSLYFTLDGQIEAVVFPPTRTPRCTTITFGKDS